MYGSYFFDGILHITDFAGYDHMLFLVALCAPFAFKHWKQVAILATAFTVGHSISLALAAFDIVRFSSDIIEFLIPITILITALFNFTVKSSSEVSTNRYVSAILFGTIHGMGFSSFFRMISSEGENFITQLFLFNLGVEVGQLIIVTAILSIIALLISTTSLAQGKLAKILSGLCIFLALGLSIDKFPG